MQHLGSISSMRLDLRLRLGLLLVTTSLGFFPLGNPEQRWSLKTRHQLSEFAIVFIYDILISSKSADEH